jgi:hypothetical protein
VQQQVLRDEDPDDVVERLLVDGVARVALLEDQLANLLLGRVDRHADDLRPRLHHVASPLLMEVEDAGEHRAVSRVDRPVLARLDHEQPELVR